MCLKMMSWSDKSKASYTNTRGDETFKIKQMEILKITQSFRQSVKWRILEESFTLHR